MSLFSKQEEYFLKPFFSNTDKNIYCIKGLPPELTGALCSRASRAKYDLRRIFLDEYIKPILKSDDKKLAKKLKTTINFLHKNGIDKIVNNEKARVFFAKWLAQYGDDSIMQMLGTYLVMTRVTQVALKHLQDQRIGIAPIEKSTRYVDYSTKIKNHYQYYTEPSLGKEYERAMDLLFDTYSKSLPILKEILIKKYPNDDQLILEKKAFDTLRGLLPSSTFSQVAFYGNAQAMEYLINRSMLHPLKELRAISECSKIELYKEIPSLLMRLSGNKSKEYQKYLNQKSANVDKIADKLWKKSKIDIENKPIVKLIEYDKDGENKIVSSILFPQTHLSWNNIYNKIKKLSNKQKQDILKTYTKGRTERWQKIGRAMENSYVRFEIVMNIGAYRDLQRHRMLTQARQLFSTHLGYDTPKELAGTKILEPYKKAMGQAKKIFEKIEKKDKFLAQYAVPMAYRIRFYQYKNLRQCFWEGELRTISQGHPDYRTIEQEKYKLLKKAYPNIAALMMVDMNDYDIARRGTIEKIKEKEKQLTSKK
ncbi:MAG: FAD-dependent thymidylate synthase [Patescibacteria group bacterium]